MADQPSVPGWTSSRVAQGYSPNFHDAEVVSDRLPLPTQSLSVVLICPAVWRTNSELAADGTYRSICMPTPSFSIGSINRALGLKRLNHQNVLSELAD